MAVPLLLLIGAYIYIQKTDKNVPVLSADLGILNDDKESDEPIAPPDEEKSFINYGPAPELTGITKWINSDAQTVAGLKGKVILINFWNYSSINSVKAFPYLNKWSQDYKDTGLVVIGVHTPEFAFEKVTGNLENAIKSHQVGYPIAQDNNYKTWTAYRNQFWPAYYLIDRDGNLVYAHYGEGNYEGTEKAARVLLGLDGSYTTPPPAESNQSKTPEMHLGLARQTGFSSNEKITREEQIYTFPKKLGANKYAMEGRWKFNEESAIHSDGFAKIKLNFDAASVSLVAEADKPTTIRVYVDGKLVKGVVVTERNLYQLFESLAGGTHTMEIEVPSGELRAFTFMFN